MGVVSDFRSALAEPLIALNRGCWDHTPIQSSLNEETIHPEVETLHFMVRRPTTQSSQLPDWYSAGVPAGQTLRRFDPLHLEGFCGGYISLPRLGGQSVGRNPLVTHFLRGALRGLQYGPVYHLGTSRWGSRLSVGLPSSLLFTNNFLLLNSEKTEVLIIGPKNHTSNNLQHCVLGYYLCGF